MGIKVVFGHDNMMKQLCELISKSGFYIFLSRAPVQGSCFINWEVQSWEVIFLNNNVIPEMVPSRSQSSALFMLSKYIFLYFHLKVVLYCFWISHIMKMLIFKWSKNWFVIFYRILHFHPNGTRRETRKSKTFKSSFRPDFGTSVP